MIKAIWSGRESLTIDDDGTGPPPVTTPDSVRIRISAAGVCGTDVHIWQQRIQFVPPPLVLGHEFTGVVEECGSAVRGLAPGDRVKCDSVVGCGHCDWCRKGATQFCTSGWEFGITRDGGWTEWLIAPQRNLHKLPRSISDYAAAILDVEVFGSVKKTCLEPGSTVAIFGDGPAGLIALQCVRILGAGQVILVGAQAERLALGRQFGADVLIDIRQTDAREALRDLTQGKGVDLAFDAVGSAEASLNALNSVRPQGKVVFYGVPEADIDGFPMRDVVLKDIVLYGALTDRTGWEELIHLVASGKMDLDAMVTHRFPLEKAGDALSLLAGRKEGAIKAVLDIDRHAA